MCFSESIPSAIDAALVDFVRCAEEQVPTCAVARRKTLKEVEVIEGVPMCGPKTTKRRNSSAFQYGKMECTLEMDDARARRKVPIVLLLSIAQTTTWGVCSWLKTDASIPRG